MVSIYGRNDYDNWLLVSFKLDCDRDTFILASVVTLLLLGDVTSSMRLCWRAYLIDAYDADL